MEGKQRNVCKPKSLAKEVKMVTRDIIDIICRTDSRILGTDSTSFSYKYLSKLNII